MFTLLSSRKVSHSQYHNLKKLVYRCISTDSTSVKRRVIFTRKSSTCLLGLGFAALGLWLFAPAGEQNFSLRYFTQATLTNSVYGGPDSKLLTLRMSPKTILDNDVPGPIWSIYIKDDDIQIERPYTPLEGVDENGEMKLWIKRYPHGEVGRWLHTKAPGDKIEIRGPQKTWEWKNEGWEKVVMISGGTGITPFYQLLHNTFNKKESTVPKTTKFLLLHSSRTPDDLPPKSLLKNLESWAKQQPDRLEIRMFVDTVSGSDKPEGLLVGRIRQECIEHELHQCELPLSKVLFLVCGPEPMVTALAGARGHDQSQGPIGGALYAIGCESRQVYKF